MLDEVDLKLKNWVQGVVGAVNVAFTLPRDTETDLTVHLYLMQIVPVLSIPDGNRVTRQVKLSYLLTVHDDDPTRQHQMIGALAFAALDSDFELEYEPLPAQTWLALGVEIQPSIVLKVPYNQDRVMPELPSVRSPMALNTAALVALNGVVVGPQDLPLQGVLVELPGLRQYQRTDSRGRFRFPAVPADPAVKKLRVSGKGHQLEVEVEQSSEEPLVIRLFKENTP